MERKECNLVKTVDTTTLHSIKVWAREFKGEARYYIVELLDANANRILLKGNDDNKMKGLQPKVYTLQQGQKWIGHILKRNEDGFYNEWVPLFMDYSL